MCKCAIISSTAIPCDSSPVANAPLPQTLESDHFVCVRQKLSESDKPQVIIINLKNNNEIVKRPINADSAIMHLTRNIIALKAQGRTIQIFDLTAKQKLKSAVMNEDVVYWNWFNENSLAMVTETSVYHWNVFDPTQSQPLKIFDRHVSLNVRIFFFFFGPSAAGVYFA